MFLKETVYELNNPRKIKTSWANISQ